MSRSIHRWSVPGCSLAILGSVSIAGERARAAGKNTRMEFDISMHSRMVSSFAGREKAIGNFAFSEFIRIAGNVPRTRGRCGCQFEKHLLRQAEPE